MEEEERTFEPAPVALRVDKKSGNYFRNLTKELQIQGLAPVKKNTQDPTHVLIPLKRAPTETEWSRLRQDNQNEVDLVELHSEHPKNIILRRAEVNLRLLLKTLRNWLTNHLFPTDLCYLLPKKWERIGDIITIKLDAKLIPFANLIGGVRMVLLDEEGIKGELREPSVRILFQNSLGETATAVTETTHVENGIKYRLDVAKCMFSSGNGTERIHFANIKAVGEVVVDMFAGIGYFSIPLAVHGGIKSIVSIEKNPNSYEFLKQNIQLNGVSHLVTPLLGDNRIVGEEVIGKADRVLMGYIPTPKQFLTRARQFLASKGGIIHYHHTCAKEEMKTLAEQHLKEELGLTNYVLLDFRIVKSYSPKQYHCVADFKVE